MYASINAVLHGIPVKKKKQKKKLLLVFVMRANAYPNSLDSA